MAKKRTVSGAILHYVGVLLTAPIRILTNEEDLTRDEVDEALLEEGRADFMGRHALSASITGMKEGLPTKDTIVDYRSSRVQTAAVFSEVTLPGAAIKISASLDDPANNAQKEAIEVALATENPDTTRILTAFQTEIDFLHEQFSKPGARFNLDAAAAVYAEEKSKAFEAIKAQHRTELTALETAVDAYATHLGLSATHTTELKESMAAALKKTHDKQLESLDKSMNAPITALKDQAQKERDRIACFGMLSRDKDMLDALDELHRKHARPGVGGVAVRRGNRYTSAYFENMNISDLPLIKTLTGQQMTIDKKTGVVHIDLPNHFWGALTSGSHYYKGNANKLLTDLQTIANTVRASGHTGMRFKLTEADEGRAKLMAKNAFKAAIRAGFDPKDVEIVLNGHVMKCTADKDALFEDDPNMLQDILGEVDSIKKQRETLAARASVPEETQNLRRALQAIRDDVRAHVPAPRTLADKGLHDIMAPPRA